MKTDIFSLGFERKRTCVLETIKRIHNDIVSIQIVERLPRIKKALLKFSLGLPM